MRRNIAERLPLTLREQEAELEAAANARALSRPTKQPASLKDVRCIRVEQLPLTPWEREAEAEVEKRELGIALPF